MKQISKTKINDLACLGWAGVVMLIGLAIALGLNAL